MLQHYVHHNKQRSCIIHIPSNMTNSGTTHSFVFSNKNAIDSFWISKPWRSASTNFGQRSVWINGKNFDNSRTVHSIYFTEQKFCCPKQLKNILGGSLSYICIWTHICVAGTQRVNTFSIPSKGDSTLQPLIITPFYNR